MDDLDAHGPLPQRAVEQAPHLEATDAESLADRVLGQVAVVEIEAEQLGAVQVAQHGGAEEHQRQADEGRAPPIESLREKLSSK